eukprot:scaffold103880_cov54-Cyclotella_meneghiniana.AAC.2
MGYEYKIFSARKFGSPKMAELPPKFSYFCILSSAAPGWLNFFTATASALHHSCYRCIIVSATSVTAQLNVSPDGRRLFDTVSLPLLQQHHLSTQQGGVVSQPPPTTCLLITASNESAPVGSASVGGGGCGGELIEEAVSASNNYVTATATCLACLAAGFRPSAAAVLYATIKYSFRGIGRGSGVEQHNN